MLQAKLSKLPKDLLIKILLKVKEEKIYKVKIGYNSKMMYVKAQSKDEVVKVMCECKEIKSAITETWCDEFNGIALNINTRGVVYWNCANNPFMNEDDWEELDLTDLFILEQERFNQILTDYMKNENISIEEIKLNEKVFVKEVENAI